MRWLCCLLSLAAFAPAQTNESLDFLEGHTDFRNVREMFPTYRKRLAEEALERRRRQIEQLRTQADVDARRRYVREQILKSVGGLPERTPLNVRVTGAIEHSDYRIEKIVFESQPKFYITANLYLPKSGRPPYPAILFPLGHEAGAKAHNVWQQLLVTFAKRGFVALAWDTLGQGERIQLYDEDTGLSKVVRSTTEHTQLGAQCLLTGDALAKYTIWDGIRALDYLLSRSEVDSKRIGLTGNSGGGTHTAYIGAIDDRIQVAAPSCYINSWSRLLDTIGPQDAEQCFPGFLAAGLDFGDFIHAFAPKPYLVLSAIRDFFSITGARETYSEAAMVYRNLDAMPKLRMVEADDGHGYTRPRRLAAYAWFDRWLRGVSEEQPEPDVAIATEEELWSTPTGQVSTSLGGETVFSLNRKRALGMTRKTPTAAEIRTAIAFDPPRAGMTVRPFGTLERKGYRIEKLIYESEPGIAIPALLYAPAKAGRKSAAIYVHSRGKSAAHADVEQLSQAGLIVLSIDARGWGETRNVNANSGSDWPGYFGDHDAAMTAILLGKTLTGMRARDIISGVDYLASHAEVNPGSIAAFGRDAGGIPVLHAAALDARLMKVAIEGSVTSYAAVVSNRIHRGIFENIIPGVLKHYDLPDLVISLAPRPVWLVDATNAVGLQTPLAEVKAEYAQAKSARIVRRRPGQSAAATYAEFVASAP